MNSMQGHGPTFLILPPTTSFTNALEAGLNIRCTSHSMQRVLADTRIAVSQAYVMTSGGPQDATLFYVLYLFRQGFGQLRMGYAAAMAWILFIIVLVLTLIQFRLANRWVYYEGDLLKRC